MVVIVTLVQIRNTAGTVDARMSCGGGSAGPLLLDSHSVGEYHYDRASGMSSRRAASGRESFCDHRMLAPAAGPYYERVITNSSNAPRRRLQRARNIWGSGSS
jgi:hypothetical protein